MNKSFYSGGHPVAVFAVLSCFDGVILIADVLFVLLMRALMGLHTPNLLNKKIGNVKLKERGGKNENKIYKNP